MKQNVRLFVLFVMALMFSSPASAELSTFQTQDPPQQAPPPEKPAATQPPQNSIPLFASTPVSTGKIADSETPISTPTIDTSKFGKAREIPIFQSDGLSIYRTLAGVEVSQQVIDYQKFREMDRSTMPERRLYRHQTENRFILVENIQNKDSVTHLYYAVKATPKLLDSNKLVDMEVDYLMAQVDIADPVRDKDGNYDRVRTVSDYKIFDPQGIVQLHIEHVNTVRSQSDGAGNLHRVVEDEITKNGQSFYTFENETSHKVFSDGTLLAKSTRRENGQVVFYTDMYYDKNMRPTSQFAQLYGKDGKVVEASVTFDELGIPKKTLIRLIKNNVLIKEFESEDPLSLESEAQLYILLDQF